MQAMLSGFWSEAGHCRAICAIWMRLPQVSSNTAMVTGPMAVGFVGNTTPRPFSRSYSCRTSSTPNIVAGTGVEERFLIGLGRREGIGLEEQLDAFRPLGRDHGQ